jgi:hypothetical protein
VPITNIHCSTWNAKNVLLSSTKYFSTSATKIHLLHAPQKYLYINNSQNTKIHVGSQHPLFHVKRKKTLCHLHKPSLPLHSYN